MHMSMAELGSSAKNVEGKMTEKLKEAQEMRQEIDAFKAQLSDVPGGLDSEIVSAIQAAEQGGRQAAISDISNVEQQANQEQQEGKQIQGQIDSKIQENKTAQGKLESLRGNRYGQGVEGGIKAIEANTSQGEQIKSNLEAAMQAVMSDINAAKSGI